MAKGPNSGVSTWLFALYPFTIIISAAYVYINILLIEQTSHFQGRFSRIIKLYIARIANAVFV